MEFPAILIKLCECRRKTPLAKSGNLTEVCTIIQILHDFDFLSGAKVGIQSRKKPGKPTHEKVLKREARTVSRKYGDQKSPNLVDLTKFFQIRLLSLSEASIQPRTGPGKSAL